MSAATTCFWSVSPRAQREPASRLIHRAGRWGWRRRQAVGLVDGLGSFETPPRRLPRAKLTEYEVEFMELSCPGPGMVLQIDPAVKVSRLHVSGPSLKRWVR